MVDNSLSSRLRSWLLEDVNDQQELIMMRLQKIMTTLADLKYTLETIGNQLLKVKDEIVMKIVELEDALQNVNLPPDAETALVNLKNAAQALDDVVPDVPPPVD